MQELKRTKQKKNKKQTKIHKSYNFDLLKLCSNLHISYIVKLLKNIYLRIIKNRKKNRFSNYCILFYFIFYL